MLQGKNTMYVHSKNKKSFVNLDKTFQVNIYHIIGNIYEFQNGIKINLLKLTY